MSATDQRPRAASDRRQRRGGRFRPSRRQGAGRRLAPDGPGGPRLAQEARPPGPGAQPGDVRGVGGSSPHLRAVRPGGGRRRGGGAGLHPGHLAASVVHGDLRQLRRGPGGGPGQGSGRQPAQGAQGRERHQAGGRVRRRSRRAGLVLRAGTRRSGAGRSRRVHPRRRRGDRGGGLGGRERHHGRERARDPRERGRPQRRHRRHPRALRLADRARHRAAGRDVPGPHDRHGGRGEEAEDPQRDRPQHPAGGAYHHLPDGGGLAAAHVPVQRGCRRNGERGVDHHPRGPPRVPGPHHHRGLAVGHRHRGHEPPGQGQRGGHVRPGGGGRGRRGRVAARQDRHHHPGQPPGDGVRARFGGVGGRTGRRRAAGVAGRRDARGSQHRGAGQERVRSARPGPCRPGRHVRALHGPDPHERGGPRRPAHPQGRSRRHRGLREGGRRIPAPGGGRPRGCHRQGGRHPTGGGRRGPGAGRHPSEGHRQGRDQGAFPRPAPHGHQDRHDHRRQPCHRGLHRGRGGRGRLPGRGHPRGQAQRSSGNTRQTGTWWP